MKDVLLVDPGLGHGARNWLPDKSRSLRAETGMGCKRGDLDLKRIHRSKGSPPRHDAASFRADAADPHGASGGAFGPRALQWNFRHVSSSCRVWRLNACKLFRITLATGDLKKPAVVVV